jgi:hypothetical protein
MLRRLDQLACAFINRVELQVVQVCVFSGVVVWRSGSGDNEGGCPFEQGGLGRGAGLGERRQGHAEWKG